MLRGCKRGKEVGHKKFVIEPKLDHLLSHAKATFHSPKGTIHSEWEMKDNFKTIEFQCEIPFDTEAKIILHGAQGEI